MMKKKIEWIFCKCGCGKKRRNINKYGARVEFILGHKTYRVIKKRIACACGCGKTLWDKSKYGQLRTYIYRHKKKKKWKWIFCKCGCGKKLRSVDKWGKDRSYIYRHSSKGNLGKHMSLESRKKLSETHKKIDHYWTVGRIKSIEERKKLSDAHKGKVFTLEHRMNLSKSKKGKKMSKKARNNISLGHKGIKTWNTGLTKEMDSRVMTLSNSMRNYYVKNPKARDLLRDYRFKQVLPMNDTLIEKRMHRLLEELKINFRKHYFINWIPHKFQSDVYLSNKKIVIECDGEYWHKYPYGKDIDHIRNKELKKIGIRIIRLWGFQINKLLSSSLKEIIDNSNSHGWIKVCPP